MTRAKNPDIVTLDQEGYFVLVQRMTNCFCFQSSVESSDLDKLVLGHMMVRKTFYQVHSTIRAFGFRGTELPLATGTEHFY
jgi:hypothetical protein